MGNLETIPSSCFPTTQWTQLIGVIQGENPEAAWEALSEFCERYRPAVFHFFRRRGQSPEKAEDYTQSFFASRILAPWGDRKTFLHAVRRSDQKKFRSFLSWMLWNFLKDQIKSETTQKSGGKTPHVSLDELLPSEESL
jgi:DNA-directed RNA polymerase specialized sigma24 family protein